MWSLGGGHLVYLLKWGMRHPAGFTLSQYWYQYGSPILKTCFQCRSRNMVGSDIHFQVFCTFGYTFSKFWYKYEYESSGIWYKHGCKCRFLSNMSLPKTGWRTPLSLLVIFDIPALMAYWESVFRQTEFFCPTDGRICLE